MQAVLFHKDGPCRAIKKTSCIPIKSNLYLASSLATAVSELAPYMLLKLHVSNKMFPFRCMMFHLETFFPLTGYPTGGVI